MLQIPPAYRGREAHPPITKIQEQIFSPHQRQPQTSGNALDDKHENGQVRHSNTTTCTTYQYQNHALHDFILSISLYSCSSKCSTHTKHMSKHVHGEAYLRSGSSSSTISWLWSLSHHWIMTALCRNLAQYSIPVPSISGAGWRCWGRFLRHWANRAHCDLSRLGNSLCKDGKIAN
jgi:hypothetical protein